MALYSYCVNGFAWTCWADGPIRLSLDIVTRTRETLPFWSLTRRFVDYCCVRAFMCVFVCGDHFF